ncbi:hypothetical protein Tco_1436564, partial [Tanacetum coccineum]
MAELKNLRYKTTMKQYQSEFEALLNQVEITEAQSVKTGVALTKQRYTPLLPTPRTAIKNRNATYPAKPATTTLALPNTQTMTKYPATTTNPPKQWLTQKEIVNPDEEIEDNSDVDLGEEGGNSNGNEELLLSECYASPQISLNAISGTPTFDTIAKTEGLFKGNQTVKVAVDEWKAVAEVYTVDGDYSLELHALLKGFYDVFAEPTELPLKRNCNHQIPLKDDSIVVNIKPYRYPPSQKDVIETMVAELLASGVVRESHSSFSSPIVLVKKKDESWRMCIDYRLSSNQDGRERLVTDITQKDKNKTNRTKPSTGMERVRETEAKGVFIFNGPT